MSLSPKHSKFIEALYKENYKLLLRSASCALGSDNKDPVAEIVQDTFLEAVQKIDTLYSHENPKAWLLTTLKYKVKSYKRTRAREAQAVTRFVSATASLDEEQASEEGYIDLSESAKGLVGDEDFKMLFDLYVAGYSYAETAEKFGVTIDVCKKQVAKAKKRLKKDFGKIF